MVKASSKTWSEFIEKLNGHLGSPRRAQTNFCENSEYSLSSLQHWRKINRVPDEAFAAVEKIDPEKCSPSNFKGYHSTKFTQRVVELSAERQTLSTIAQTLSQEFGRNVTENMVKGVRYRNKSEIESYQSREKQG
jgi:uncharacterized protein (DUF885 family)